MCEMCDKFKTCVACEYGGCEEHRAVEELAKPVNDSSVTAGTDRAVDAMKEVKNWFTDNYNDSTEVGINPKDDDGSNPDPNMYPNSDTTGGTTGGSQIRDNMFELLRDTIAAVPQKYWSRLGIGYTTMSGQSFPEACALHGADAPVSFGPQGEPIFRFDLDQPRDPDGKFAGGEASGASAQSPEFEKQETKIEGDVKTTKYVSPNHSIIVEHNTKEGKVTVKHLDKNGDLLVQQTHDSIGAARKELTTQGIDHKFYALRSEQRADDEGGEWITIHGAHVFIKDGVIEKGPEGFVGKTPQEIGSSSSNGTAGPPPLATWTSGASSACSRMRNEAKKDIEEGRADSNALVVACRKDDLTGEAHRGIAVPETSGVLKYKVGDEIQLMPQSFSYDKGIAQNFAKSEKDIHNDKFILHPDKTGPRWESVMFHVSASGAKGWNIGSNTKYKVHDEAEVAMQGRYRVTGVKHGTKGYDFSLEQIGTF